MKQPEPCPRCVALYDAGEIRGETVMPLPKGALAPLAVDTSKPCCYDCASADTFERLGYVPQSIYKDDRAGGWVMARIAIGNERQEEFRLPGIAQHRFKGIVRPSRHGDLERHHRWLDHHFIELGTKPIRPSWTQIDLLYPEASAAWDVYAKTQRIHDAIRVALEPWRFLYDAWPSKRAVVFTLDDEDQDHLKFAYDPAGPRPIKLNKWRIGMKTIHGKWHPA